MSDDFLEKMVRHKLETMKAKKVYYENLIKNMKSPEGGRYAIFKKAISKPGGINLIAEIKKASPSVGLIREDFNAEAIARIYVQNKAVAISVLTEDKYFLGKFSYLSQVSQQAAVPVLMKDFIVHEYQIYEGLFHGASAVLLIVAMLSSQQLKDLMQLARRLGLDCLVEVHDETEVERALACGADIIGINNRDLQTLRVDLNNCLKLIPLIPKDVIIVAESGLKSHADVLQVRQAGAHAVLIGETFMRAPDIGAKVKEVMYGTR